jgi:hypothetical protein
MTSDWADNAAKQVKAEWDRFYSYRIKMQYIQNNVRGLSGIQNIKFVQNKFYLPDCCLVYFLLFDVPPIWNWLLLKTADKGVKVCLSKWWVWLSDLFENVAGVFFAQLLSSSEI